MLKTFVRGLRSPEDVRTVTYTQPKSLEAAVDALAYSSTLQVAEPASTKKVRRAHTETSSSESETSGFPTTAGTSRQQNPVMDKLTKILEHIHPNSTAPNTSSESFQQANVQVTYPNSPDQQQWHYRRNPNSTAAPAQASHRPQFDTPQRGRGRPRATFRGNSRGGYRGRREFCGLVGHVTRECRRAVRARALLDQQAPSTPGYDPYYKTAVTWYNQMPRQNPAWTQPHHLHHQLQLQVEAKHTTSTIKNHKCPTFQDVRETKFRCF